MSLIDGAVQETEQGWNQQPPPIKNDLPAVWDLVLTDLTVLKFSNQNQQQTLEILVRDIKKRDAVGAKKYGVRLQPFNSRNALQDAYEEQLDALVYLRSKLFELEQSHVITPNSEMMKAGCAQVYATTIDSAMKLRFMLSLESKEIVYNEQPATITGDRGGSEESRHDQPNLIIP